jgi:hypothetical protein
MRQAVDKEQVTSDPFYRHALICIGGLAVFAWSFYFFVPRDRGKGLEAVFVAGIVTAIAYHVFLFRLAGRCKGLNPDEIRSLRRGIVWFGPAGVVDFLWKVQRATRQGGPP